MIMAKMRKRTKVSLIILGVFGLAVAGAALAIGLGAVALLPQMIAFDIAILGGGVAIGAAITAGTFAISGLISRKRALRKSAESVASMAKVGQVDKSINSAIVKVKDNSLKSAKTFAKSSYKLSKFGIAPITNEREHYGTNKEQLKFESKKYVYGLMNDLYSQNGRTKVARKFDKKAQRVGKKVEKLNDVSAFAPKYHVSAEFFNPISAEWQNDERSSVYFNNNEIAKVAKQVFENSIFQRYSKQNKNRGATKITIKSRGGEQTKEISASCNAEELVDTMETLALMDYNMTTKKTGISGYPIIVETQKYKLDGTKKGKPEVMQIRNEKELKDRIYVLNSEHEKAVVPTGGVTVYKSNEKGI